MMEGIFLNGLVLLFYCAHESVIGSSPPTFNMHGLCDHRTWADQFTEWKGGFLIFDSNLLPANDVHECVFFLQVETYGSSDRPGISFSFSEWEMEGDCNAANLTIYDGNEDPRIPKLYSPMGVQGLDNPICGSSQGVVNNTMYFSTDTVLTLVFQSTRQDWRSHRLKFNMTFLSYFQGSCDSYDNTFACNNTWCIDKKFTCLNLNPCGDRSDCKCKISCQEGKQFWENLLDNLCWLIAIIVGGSFAIKFLQVIKKRYNGIENIPVIKWIREIINRNTANQGRRPRIPSRTSDRSARVDSVVMETRSLSRSVSSDEESHQTPPRSRTSSLVLSDNEPYMNNTNPTEPPPSYHELHELTPVAPPDELERPPKGPTHEQKMPPKGPTHEQEMPPPPSYEEVMKNNLRRSHEK